MRGKLLFLGVCAAVLVTTLLWAGDPWRDKLYTEWRIADVSRVLENSPWVRSDEIIVNFRQLEVTPEPKRKAGSPNSHTVRELRQTPEKSPQEVGIDIGERDRKVLYFEWSSSLTVRQAMVREAQLQHKENKQAAQQLLRWQPPQYVISVSGSAMSLFAEGSEETVRQESYLKLKPSGRVIPAAQVEFVREGLLLARVRFYFPRQTQGEPVISPGEKKVQFTCKSPGTTIGMEFDLRKMTRDGKPDL